MIGFLRGSVSALSADSTVLLDVSGVGYEVFIPLKNAHLYTQKEDILIYTHHKIAEGVNDLYGFPSLPERDFFKVLLGVSGIGPKSALGLMEFTIETLRNAIETEDVSLLTKAPGLGKKTASRLILDLKGKLPSLDSSTPAKGKTVLFADAIMALVSLGYSEKEVQQLFSDNTKDLQGKSDEELVKWGLGNL